MSSRDSAPQGDAAPPGHVLATAGHVDHGKSTLVLALTGMDPDRFAEEKERGLTIDLGFAWTTLGTGTTVAFVDVPGHVRFIKNMLAGVGAVDACVFVVAATEGWKPQSEEHLRILEMLGVGHGVVALTKAGLVDDETRELAALEVAGHLEGTFLEAAPVLSVDPPTGAGMDALVRALDDLVGSTPPAPDRERARLWIDRTFPVRGAGTVVTGTLTGGTFRLGDAVEVVPGGLTARIRGLQSHHLPRTAVGPGNRVAVNLAGVSHSDLRRGHAVVHPGRWEPTRSFDASLVVLAGLDHPVSRRGAYQLYVGSGEHPVRIRILGPEALQPGEAGLVRLHLPDALPLLPGDRYVLRESGRAETVGGGEVLDISPVLPAARARPDRRVERVVEERGWVDAGLLERLTGRRLAPTVGERWVVSEAARAATAADLARRVDSAGPQGLDAALLDERERALAAGMDDLALSDGRLRRPGREAPVTHPWLDALDAEPFQPPPPEGVDRVLLRRLAREGRVVEADGIWFSAAAVDQATRQVARLLAASPEGITASAVREALGTSRKYALPLLAHLDASGVTRRRGDVRVPGPRLPSPGLASAEGGPGAAARPSEDT